ncbi:ABC transporter permease [Nocardia macrotermitis]|uniref:Doxorubicin resistance ABC transporter permease protein DrrB n=1 Tax=Nocardia macrotermitis TaxID=2585198 RepID=A0A7K0CYN2_9NOCA|nr:ABC transporter permease [Nocardia macrotermitis]MQY18586.1 Doxorubicin resistance ABC transporter permease protein DrrB [Nocardia macrotermitis]
MQAYVAVVGGGEVVVAPSTVRQWWVLTLRMVRASVRNGELVTALLAPSVFTLGFYVPLNRVMSLGHGVGSYSQFLLPMIVMQAVSFCAGAAALRAATDARDGLDERFASMPMSVVTPLVARTTATLYRILVAVSAAIVCGYVIGARFRGTVWHTIGFVIFAALVGLLLGLLGDLLGALSRSPEATTQALVLPQLILGMVSTGFAPAEQFPDWIRGFARDQPVSGFVNVMRALSGDPGPVSWAILGPGLLWLLAGLVLFGVASAVVAGRRHR